MCTGGDQVPGSAAEALRMTGAGLDYLNGPAGDELTAASCGTVLRSLGEVHARLSAAHVRFLARFDAADAHNADGYGTSATWLTAMAKMSGKDARAAMHHMRVLGRHRPLADALAAGDISVSWADQILAWIKKLPFQLREDTETILAIEKILVQAAASGASLDDLGAILTRAVVEWQAAHPDPDEDDGFDDRFVQTGSTFGGAWVLRGNLTPECAAAVQAVLEALGKKAGPEDHRTEGQRFHDALQLGCELLIRARMVPGRAGADTQVMVHMALAWLREKPGASAIEDAWLTGLPGHLAGIGAEVAACDALIVPVVTGRADMTIIDTIIDLALSATGLHHGAGGEEDLQPDPARGHDDGGHAGNCQDGSCRGGDCHGGDGGRGDERGTGVGRGSRGSADHAAFRGRQRARAKDRAQAPSQGRAGELSPEARQALRYAIGRLAIDFVSGPGGIAAALRTGLLQPPYATPSLPLDIGYSHTIPASIRRAVLLRDKHCAWPRCGRPAAWCDVHHLHHKQNGGTTSVDNCVLLCQYHHDIAVHRDGWQLILHPDGTTTAHGPHGQTLHSHSPPTPRAA